MYVAATAVSALTVVIAAVVAVVVDVAVAVVVCDVAVLVAAAAAGGMAVVGPVWASDRHNRGRRLLDTH